MEDFFTYLVSIQDLHILKKSCNYFLQNSKFIYLKYVDWQDSNLRATIIMFTIDFIQLVIMAPDQSEVAPVHHAIIFFIPNSIFCFLLFKVL